MENNVAGMVTRPGPGPGAPGGRSSARPEGPKKTTRSLVGSPGDAARAARGATRRGPRAVMSRPADGWRRAGLWPRPVFGWLPWRCDACDTAKCGSNLGQHLAAHQIIVGLISFVSAGPSACARWARTKQATIPAWNSLPADPSGSAAVLASAVLAADAPVRSCPSTPEPLLSPDPVPLGAPFGPPLLLPDGVGPEGGTPGPPVPCPYPCPYRNSSSCFPGLSPGSRRKPHDRPQATASPSAMGDCPQGEAAGGRARALGFVGWRGRPRVAEGDAYAPRTSGAGELA